MSGKAPSAETPWLFLRLHLLHSSRLLSKTSETILTGLLYKLNRRLLWARQVGPTSLPEDPLFCFWTSFATSRPPHHSSLTLLSHFSWIMTVSSSSQRRSILSLCQQLLSLSVSVPATGPPSNRSGSWFSFGSHLLFCLSFSFTTPLFFPHTHTYHCGESPQFQATASIILPF